MKHWYLFYTQFNHEKKVHTALLKVGFVSYLPLFKKDNQWSDRIKEIEVPMFPSYNFVYCEASDIYSVLSQKGIVGAVKFAGKFASVSEKEMLMIKHIEAFPNEVEVYGGSFEKGEKINILSGSFTGFSGELVKIDEGKRSVILLIDLFGTQVVTSVQSARISKSA